MLHCEPLLMHLFWLQSHQEWFGGVGTGSGLAVTTRSKGYRATLAPFGLATVRAPVIWATPAPVGSKSVAVGSQRPAAAS